MVDQTNCIHPKHRQHDIPNRVFHQLYVLSCNISYPYFEGIATDIVKIENDNETQTKVFVVIQTNS